MNTNRKPSFFERLTGGMRLASDTENLSSDIDVSDDDETVYGNIPETKSFVSLSVTSEPDTEIAELSVDVYYNNHTIYIQTMVAGISKTNLDIIISREQVTIKGTRSRTHSATVMEQYLSELYWGPFERTIDLPDEIDIEKAEATELNGLVTITLPKFDKEKKANLKIK